MKIVPMIFSVAHATARPYGWQNSFNSALMTQGFGCVGQPYQDIWCEYILSVDRRFGNFSTNCMSTAPDSLVCLDPRNRKCAVSNWINAINHCQGDVILVSSDDFVYPVDWSRRLVDSIGDRNPHSVPFVIHVSTGGERDDELMTFQILSRAVIRRWGYALWHEYDGMYVDDDFTKHAYTDPGVEVIQARHLLFEHRHFAFGKSVFDEVYAHENRPEALALGAKIFARRQANNFKEFKRGELFCI